MSAQITSSPLVIALMRFLTSTSSAWVGIVARRRASYAQFGPSQSTACHVIGMDADAESGRDPSMVYSRSTC